MNIMLLPNEILELIIKELYGTERLHLKREGSYVHFYKGDFKNYVPHGYGTMTSREATNHEIVPEFWIDKNCFFAFRKILPTILE